MTNPWLHKQVVDHAWASLPGGKPSEHPSSKISFSLHLWPINNPEDFVLA